LKKSLVIDEQKCPYYQVQWGLTKGIIAKESEASSENIQIRITEYKPFFEHSMHAHETQEEIIFVLEGKGYSETSDGKKELYPGCAAYVPKGVPHATVNPYDEPMKAIVIKVPPDKEVLK